jgi:predicted transcriptional regulator
MSIINKPKTQNKKKRLAPAPAVQTESVSAEPVNVKDEMRAMLDRLPDDLTWERLIYHIKVRIAIETALEEADRGEGYTEKEMGERINKWFAKK